MNPWSDTRENRLRERLLRELRDRLLDALHADQPLTDRDELKRLVRQVEDVL